MAGLGSLVIELAANTARLSSDMGRAVNIAESAAAKIQKTFAIAGGGFFGAAFIADAFRAADVIGDAAKRANVSAESFSRLAYAANLSDVSMGALETGVAKLQKTLGQVALGSGPEAAKALERLGLSAKDLIGLPLERQLGLISDRLRGVASTEEQAAIAAALFGKGVNELLPLLRLGSEGIAKLTKESDQLGITMSGATAAGIDAADSALKRLKGTLSAFGGRLVGSLALALSPPTDPIERARLEVAQLTIEIEKYQKARAQGSGGGFISNAELDAVAKKSAAVENLIRLEKEARVAAKPEQDQARARESEAFQKQLQEFNAETARLLAAAQKEAAKESYDAWLEVTVKINRQWQEDAETLRRLGEQGARELIELSDKATEEGLEKFQKETKNTAEKGQEDLSTFADQAARNMQSAFADFFFDPFKDGLDGLLKSFINVIKRMLAEALAAKLLEALGFPGSGGGGGGGFFSAFTKLLGFADGGSFKVGGNGGTDSQVVAFRASPNETVSVTKPGQGSGGGASYAPVFNISVDSRSDRAAVAADMARIAQDVTAQGFMRFNEMIRRNGGQPVRI